MLKDGKRTADPEQRRVDRHVVSAHGEARSVSSEHGNGRPGHGDRQQRAGQTEQHTFREKGPPQRRPARAERRAHSQFSFAAD